MNRSIREAAHDLNNLLTAIIGAAEAALHRSGLDDETQDDLAHILEGARRGAALVREISGDAPDAPRLIWVNETIRATSRLLSHRLGSNIALHLALAEPDIQVMAVPWAIDRILLNLIANAGHAMPSGGIVTVHTGTQNITKSQQKFPDIVPPGDYVVIAVVDNGTGIPRDQIPSIFSPGFTTRRGAGGSGLGLSSVLEVVRESSGFLSVDSAEGIGTRVEIYFPLEAEGQEAPAQVVGQRARIVLLVDDDPLVLRTAERVLHRAGWTVRTAGSAEDALAVLNETSCDLMISDLAMPGMDGLALTRLAHARSPELPVLLISGYHQPAGEPGDHPGKVTFLTKPYDQKDLLAAVARMMSDPMAR